MFHCGVARGPVNRIRMRQQYERSPAVLGVFIIDSHTSDIGIVSAASTDRLVGIVAQ